MNCKLKEEDASRPDEMFKLHELDSLDIYEVKDAQEIYDFLSHAIPFCRYCKCSAITEVPWERSKLESSEWVDF